MQSCLVTIVVPVYNVEKYLDTCIESILKQTYENLEIILVNDGSTDSSLEICKAYLFDNRISIIDKKNEGLSSARQTGIDVAKGKYICMIDSDDYIEKNFVEKMYLKIDSDKSDICVCASRFYSDNFNMIHGFSNKINTILKITKQDIELNYFNLLGRYYMSDSWNKIYRTDFIRNTGIKFSLDKKFNGTDLLFNHSLMLHLPQISILNQVLYNHQILENSRVRRKNKQLQKGFMIIMNQIINEVDKNGFSNMINQQLNLIYLGFLREASQDIFNSTTDSKELENKFKEFYIENKKYLLENQRLDLDSKQMITFSQKIFTYCLKSNTSLKLFKYLKLRKKILIVLDRIRDKSN